MSVAKWMIPPCLLVLLLGCSRFASIAEPETVSSAGGGAAILHCWQGDFPVAQLKLLPEDPREPGVGFIDEPETFESVWTAFNPSMPVPAIDFNRQLVIFTRNTKFYNSIRIVKVNLKNGVAEVLATETLAALPIEEKAALAMAVVSREGISGIRAGRTVIPVRK